MYPDTVSVCANLNLCNTIRLWSFLPAQAAACCLRSASSRRHRGSKGKRELGACFMVVSQLLDSNHEGNSGLLDVAGRGAGARAGHQADSH